MKDYLPVEQREEEELPIPTEWRSKISEIVNLIRNISCLTAVDSELVDPIPTDNLKAINHNISIYGCAIDPLSSSTWITSIYRWMNGYWQVLVDLYSDGLQIDLVLFLKVTESEGEYRFHVESVHVP